MHADGVADGSVVGALDDGVDAAAGVAQATRGWAVGGDDRAPGGITALGGGDGGAVDTRDWNEVKLMLEASTHI